MTKLQSMNVEMQGVQPTTGQGGSGAHQASDQYALERPPPRSWIAVGNRSTDYASRTGR